MSSYSSGRQLGGIMGSSSIAEIPGILERAFALSKAGEGERVVLLSTHLYDELMAEAARIALNNLGADFVRVVLPPKADGMRPAQPLGAMALDVIKQAQMVIRIAPKGFHHPQTPDVPIYHPMFNEVFKAGTRWLDFMMDYPPIWRLFPTPELIERTNNGAARMEKAKVIRVTSEAGTDLTMRKDGRKGARQCGVVDEPGMWDNFGFGMVACAPLEDSANGILVISPGDRAGQLERLAVDTERIVMRFEAGRITSIDGGANAEVLRRHLTSFNNPDVYRIAHIGWGTHDRAIWGGPGFTIADWESYSGALTLHFGTNIFDTPARHTGLGGKVPAGTYHWGGGLLNHSFWLDDEQIVKDGKIVARDLR
jgi:2,5-dihydroxypyridine 5,6-dioxygenase